MNLVHVIEDPARSGRRRPGCLRIVGITLLLLAAAMDLSLPGSSGHSIWPRLPALLTGLAALLWPAARRPAWLTLQLRTFVPPLVSAACTLFLTFSHDDAIGPGQPAILLCLLMVAVRSCPPRWVGVCAVLNAAALLALPVPYMITGSLASTSSLQLMGLLLIGGVSGLAAYLRSLDQRRAAAVTEIRRAERMVIAADLHDFVAHHVTGILVQTQMARMMAVTQPDRLDLVLAGIERAATEALASMRHTVGVLRDNTDGERRPVGDLAAIVELVDGFTGQHVTLHRDPSVPDTLPHEVQAAAFRVVQEALTNVRRHAADAAEVAVGLRYDGRNLEIRVTDNGRGGTQLPDAARGGGFGLVGLTERVTALGGELRAGPRPEGHGWQVLALLPAPKP